MSVVSHEDSNTNEPNSAELASSPDATHPITGEESQESTRDRAELDHGRDIALDVRQVAGTEGVETETFLEYFGVEDPSDQTLVNTASGTHEAKCENCEP